MTATATSWAYVWHWKKVLPERFGHSCRVLSSSRGNMGARVLVEFLDGTQVEAPRAAIRRAPA